jgi:tryptophanyl-tRNA synthetase
MKKPTLVSGIQPTGRLHLGNYLGALKNFVALQNSKQYQCYFFIADYHAITEDISDLNRKVADLGASYLAAGLDPDKSTLFLQSTIAEHAELAWILNTVTPFGELTRMTQFKDKSERQVQNINAGLFIYPILMTANILLYDAVLVPVGDDQDQHLELTRTIARRFNNKYGEIFIEPKPLHTFAPRIMSLQDPTKKMSKSDPKGCLYLDEEPESIEKKIKSAVTDSGSTITFEENKKPAVSNLLRIFSGISGKPIKTLEKEFEGKGYADFKSSLARVISDHFTSFREKKSQLLKDPEKIKHILNLSAKKARAVATKKMATVINLIYLK